MEPTTPERWRPLVQQAMHAGDLEAALRLYEPGAALASARADFEVDIAKVVRSGDLALLHSEAPSTRPRSTTGYAREVRRQEDGR